MRPTLISLTLLVAVPFALSAADARRGGRRHEAHRRRGGSCGVNQAVQLARWHAEVGSLVLLAGPTNRDGRDFLRRTPWEAIEQKLKTVKPGSGKS